MFKSSHLDRERYAVLVESVEWAAAAAALTAYQRMAISALRVGDAAEHSRRATADAVAATAEVIADRVTDAAAEIHTSTMPQQPIWPWSPLGPQLNWPGRSAPRR